MAGLNHVGVLRRCLNSSFIKLQKSGKRCIVSEAYLCNEEWKKRSQSPFLKDLKMDQYFIETDKKFGIKSLVSGIDIDLFANNIRSEEQLDELEHLLYRFRRTKRSTEIMDSTVYAVIRNYLKYRQYDSLFRILNDRESYGIFPDLYSYNILMSTFLKQKLYKEAADIAILMMLQEDFSNRISCLLGIASCHRYLTNLSPITSKNSEAEAAENEKNADEDEEEETFVRVPFLRNPFFDDHFDITNFKHLVGKTCYLLGRELDDVLGKSYQLIGLGLYRKWEKALDRLTAFADVKDATILREAVERLSSEIANIPDIESNTRDKLSPQFQELIRKLESNNQLINGDLETCLEDSLRKVADLEERDIAAQRKLFEVWESQRMAAWEHQNAELDRERRLKAVAEKKEYLLWKEKLLFFFENEDKNLDEMKKAEEITLAMKQQHKGRVEEVYVVPEMVKKRPERLTKYKKLARVKKL